MATQVTDTLSQPDASTVRVGCAAHALEGEQRQQLAVQMLARTEPVSKLAKQHQVSRKFLYDQAGKGEQALEQAFKSPPPSDEEVLFYLPVTRAWLRQVVLGLVLLCHSSFRGVIAFFADLLDQRIALGTVHNIVQEAVVEARRINAGQDLSGVRAGGHDEWFQGREPMLAGIDLDSLYCYLLAAEGQRDAETWTIDLWDLAERGLKPDYVVADGGKGLRTGQTLAWPGVASDGDVFHGLQPPGQSH